MNDRTLRDRLSELEIEIANSPIDLPPPYARTASLWADAGTTVTDDVLEFASAAGEHAILTRHARPLSWLMFALEDIVSPGAFEREFFFGRLAEAANTHLAERHPETDDWRPLLLAVVRAARQTAIEMRTDELRRNLRRRRREPVQVLFSFAAA